MIAVLAQSQAALVSNLTMATAGGPPYPPTPPVPLPPHPSSTAHVHFNKHTHAHLLSHRPPVLSVCILRTGAGSINQYDQYDQYVIQMLAPVL